MAKTTDARIGRERLEKLCVAALEELRAERAAAEPCELRHIDEQIETLRDMLHWARSKH